AAQRQDGTLELPRRGVGRREREVPGDIVLENGGRAGSERVLHAGELAQARDVVENRLGSDLEDCDPTARTHRENVPSRDEESTYVRVSPWHDVNRGGLGRAGALAQPASGACLRRDAHFVIGRYEDRSSDRTGTKARIARLTAVPDAALLVDSRDAHR